MDSADTYTPDSVTRPVSKKFSVAPLNTYSPLVTVPHPYAARPIPPTPADPAPPLNAWNSTTDPTRYPSLSRLTTESLEQLKQALKQIQQLPKMADPLSLMASLIAVATAGIQVSQTLYKLADAVGNANEEIVSIGKEVSAFSRVLEDLHEFLDDAKDLISNKALANANRILNDCKEIFAKIEKMLGSCENRTRFNLWQGLQWSFRREKVRPMCAKLESFKLTLTIMLSTMKLAKCKKGIRDGSPHSDSREQRFRASLEADILNNSAAIIRWQRAELEVQNMHNGNPYVAQKPISITPSKELQWLSDLVPYKPSQSQTGSGHQLRLPGIPETSGNLNDQAQVQIIKTVDKLLTKWTTLYVLNEDRGREGKRQPSKKPESRPTSKVRHQAAARDGHQNEVDVDPKDDATADTVSTASRAIDSEEAVQGHQRGNVDGQFIDDLDMCSDPRPPLTDQPSQNSIEPDTNEAKSEHKDNEDILYDVQAGDDVFPGQEDSKDNADDSVGHPDISSKLVYPSEPHETFYFKSTAATEHDTANSRPASRQSTSSGESPIQWPPHYPPYPVMPYTDSPYAALPNVAAPYGPTYGHAAYNFPALTGYARTMYTSQHPSDHVSYMNSQMTQAPYPGLSSNTAPPPPPPQSPPPLDHDDQSSGRPDQSELIARIEALLLADRERWAEDEERRRKKEAATASAEKEQKEKAEADLLAKTTLVFKDPIGRKYTIPFRLCQKWKDMKKLIQGIFVHVEDCTLVECVEAGAYDLHDASGATILPQLWEATIEPDCTISMHMWPLPESTELPKQKGPKNFAPQAPPAAPIPPPAVSDHRSCGVETETESETQSVSTGDDNDDRPAYLPWQGTLAESFTKLESKFHQTWDAAMTKSRAAAQKTILEMWLREGEAQLQNLNAVEAGDEQIPQLALKTTSLLKEPPQASNKHDTVPNHEEQPWHDTARLYSAYPASNSQDQGHSQLPMGNGIGSGVCRACHSTDLLILKPDQPHQLLGLTSAISVGPLDHHIDKPETQINLPQSSVEQRLETLEDLIRRKEADQRAKLDEAKAIANEQRLNRLEQAIIPTVKQTPLQTPPQTPIMTQPDSVSLATSVPIARPASEGIANRPASSSSGRSSFRKRLFGRSASSG